MCEYYEIEFRECIFHASCLMLYKVDFAVFVRRCGWTNMLFRHSWVVSKELDTHAQRIANNNWNTLTRFSVWIFSFARLFFTSFFYVNNKVCWTINLVSFTSNFVCRKMFEYWNVLESIYLYFPPSFHLTVVVSIL